MKLLITNSMMQTENRVMVSLQRCFEEEYRDIVENLQIGVGETEYFAIWLLSLPNPLMQAIFRLIKRAR